MLIPRKEVPKGKQVYAAASQVSADVYIQPPFAGLNFRDPLPQTLPTDCTILHNFIPLASSVKIRGGCKKWATGFPTEVISLVSYTGKNAAAYRLFAQSATGLYDVTAQTATPPLAVTLPVANEEISSTMFCNDFSDNLIVAAQDVGMWVYDGTAWTQLLAADFTGGLDPANVRFVFTWKGRLWLITKASSGVWYLPYGQYKGKATFMELGNLMKLGGVIRAGIDWTVDSGDTISSKIVFVTSLGEAIIFSGTDPEFFDTFSKDGVWYIGRPPSGSRFFLKKNAMLWFITELGLVTLQDIISGSYIPQASQIAIQQRLIADVSGTRGQKGWSMAIDDDSGVMVIGTPNNSWRASYVMNLSTKAIATSDLPIRCQKEFNGDLYTGSYTGLVFKAFAGRFDYEEFDGSGVDIVARLLYRMSAYGSPRFKVWKMVQPFFHGEYKPTIRVKMVVDFYRRMNIVPGAFAGPSGGIWDEGIWDEALWSGASLVFRGWAGLQGAGYVGAVGIVVTGDPETEYMGATVIYETGGVM